MNYYYDAFGGLGKMPIDEARVKCMIKCRGGTGNTPLQKNASLQKLCEDNCVKQNKPLNPLLVPPSNPAPSKPPSTFKSVRLPLTPAGRAAAAMANVNTAGNLDKVKKLVRPSATAAILAAPEAVVEQHRQYEFDPVRNPIATQTTRGRPLHPETMGWLLMGLAVVGISGLAYFMMRK